MIWPQLESLIWIEFGLVARKTENIKGSEEL